MAFTELLEKMVNGQALTDLEKQTLLLEARRMEQTASIIQSIVQPGTGVLKVDHFIANDASIQTANIQDATIQSATAGGGDVSISDDGIWIANQQAVFGFEDSTNTRFNLYISSDGDDGVRITDKIAGGWIWLAATPTTGAEKFVGWGESSGTADRMEFRALPGDNGSGFNAADAIEIRGQGASGGATFLRMTKTTNDPTLASNTAFHMYMKGTKLVIQSGSYYFYFDLASATNQQWTYSATAP